MQVKIMSLWVTLLGFCCSASAQQVGAGEHDAHTQRAVAVTAPAVPNVVDNSGKVVGHLFSDGVILNMKGTWVFAPLRRLSVGTTYSASELLWDDDTQLKFATTDCSGPPHIPAHVQGVSGLFRPSVIQRQGHVATLYIAGPGDSVPTPFHSQASGNGGFAGAAICQKSDGIAYTWPVASSVDLFQLYPEPLHLQ
ncbi:hypothetical protein WN982_16865 [Paraburkholderia sp. IMGN_8]|uniref:hypothetical protein n=1 Tax=Paraburkholderia sp. IMGN_8 TaxID=3136564 RepID=UPI00310199E4